jgi:hypothetical protein
MNMQDEPLPGTSPSVVDEPPSVIPPAAIETAKPERVRHRAGRGAIAFSIVLAAGLGAAGYYGWTHPSPQARQQANEAVQQALSSANTAARDQTESITQEFGGLAARITKLENAPPPAPPPPPDLGDLRKRIDDLSAKVDALASSAAAPAPVPAPQPMQPPSDMASAQALTDLGQRVAQVADAQKAALDQLSARLDQIGPKVDTLSSQAAQIGRRLDQAGTRLDEFETRIAALEKSAGQAKGTAVETAKLARIEAALAALQAGRPLGVLPDAPPALAQFATVAPPTEAKLRDQFPALADHAEEVSRPDLKGRGFWQRTLTRLQSAVMVRQGADVIVGDPAAGVLGDARVKVQNGDLAGAVTTLHALTGPAASVMKSWEEQASALVAARAALADMAAHA